MNRMHALLAVVCLLGVAAPAAAQDEDHTLQIEQVEDATAEVRGNGRVALCEGSCELTLESGDYTIESTRLRGPRPIPITVDGDASLRVRTRSNRGWRIFGGIAGAVTSAIGLGMLGSAARNDCSDDFLCFRELTMRIGGAIFAAGVAFGLSLTLIRDRTIRVEPGALR